MDIREARRFRYRIDKVSFHAFASEDHYKLAIDSDRMSGATILSCVYGYEVTKPDDELIRAIERAADHLGRAVLPSSKAVVESTGPD